MIKLKTIVESISISPKEVTAAWNYWQQSAETLGKITIAAIPSYGLLNSQAVGKSLIEALAKNDDSANKIIDILHDKRLLPVAGSIDFIRKAISSYNTIREYNGHERLTNNRYNTHISEVMTNVPIQHVQQANVNQLSNDFVNYIKHVENGISKGFDKNKNMWYPYQDSAGWNIGYGHLIKSTTELESLKKGVTQEYVNKLLDNDLKRAEQSVQDYIKKTYKVNIMLTQRQNEMLTDFAYNLGSLNKFPKFVHAVLYNNMEEMRKQYKRYANGKELTGRNKAFYNRFLK